MSNKEAKQEVQLNEVQPQRKLGQGALGAATRQGFSELTNALKAFPDSLPLIEQPGQLNNVPPAGVSQQAGFTSPPSAYQMRNLEDPNYAQTRGVQMVTSHGKASVEKPGIASQMRDEIKANLPAPEVNQEISK